MRLKLLSVMGLAALLWMPTPASATKYAAEFLKIPVGARAIGMGGAFTAVTDDATSPLWNPAGMVFLPYREVIVQHQEKFGNLLNHDYVGAVLPLGGKPGREFALGLSLVRLAIDNIPITPRPGGLKPGDWLDYGTDNDPTTPGNGQGNGVWDPGERLLITQDDLFLASSSDLALNVAIARQHGKHFTYGANVKFVRQSIPDTIPGEHVTSFGAGLDAAVIWMPTDAITFGAVAKDLTTTYLSWSNGTRETVFPTLETGVSFNFVPSDRQALTWAIDLGWAFERRGFDAVFSAGVLSGDLRTGLEYWYNNTFALRSGLNGKDLAFGAGVRYKQFGADYAAQLHRFFASDETDFPDDTDLDATHLVSIGLSW